MKKFNNIKDAINWIQVQRRFLGNKDLNKLKDALNKLNLNLKNIKKIHVLGTNGKGSTQALISNILINNDLKVGSFTSPYLITFNERLKINNNNILDEDLLNLINYFYNFNIKYNFNLSFFEILTLMSFKYFSDNNCDVIIIEAGIGGRLDSTNIINYDQTIITSIGYDHTNILGSTLKEIASEKVGALKSNGLLITYNDKEYDDVINDKVKETNSKLISINKDEVTKHDKFYYYNNLKINLKLLGKHQVYNAVLALNSVKQLYGYKFSDMIEYINDTTWAGRFENIKNNIYIDGAHNINAIEALINTINDNFSNNKIHIIFSALKDKQINNMLSLLKKENYKITLTSFEDPRYESLINYESKNIKYEQDVVKLINHIDENEITIFTGSLHFIGYIKEITINMSSK